MYSLLRFLTVLATGAFVHAFVLGRRRYVAVFALLLAALLYTHNWAFFFAAGAAVALVVVARDLPRPRTQLTDAALAFGAAALAYLPWLPTLVFQALHTGAPWSSPPSLTGLVRGAAVVSGRGPTIALVLVGGSGLVAVLKQRRSGERTAVMAMLVLAATTLVTAWLYSQFSPAWANRYLAVLLGPVLLLAAVGLSRAGRLGLAALALVLVLSLGYRASDSKSNVAALAAATGDRLQPGDLVVSTHPEQVPVLAYYLPPGLRYATPLGVVREPRVMDWRDAVTRLRRARLERTLTPLLDRMPVGRRLLLVLPVVENDAGWEAPWTRLVRDRSDEWAAAVRRDPRFFSVQTAPTLDEDTFKGVHATLYVKVRRSPSGESRMVP